MLIKLWRHQANLEEGYTAVYDADLEAYFDSIPHDKLMAAVEMRIADRSVLKLIRMWLKSQVVERNDKGGKTISAKPEKGNATRRGDLAPAGEYLPALV
jgi:RNA-directed DNA polymerase